MSKANEERLKISATYLNGIAIAIFAVGSLAPFFSYLYGSGEQSRPLWVVLTVSAICTAASGGLHLIARRILKGMPG